MKTRLCLTVMALFAIAALLTSGNVPRKSAAQTRQTVPAVLLQVTVTDAANRWVTRLEPKHFEVYEDGVRQEVTALDNEDAPVSLGVVLNTSASVKTRLASNRDPLKRLIENRRADDEFFLHSYNDSARPGALSQALWRAAERMRAARHPKLALVWLADTQSDSFSSDSGELRASLKQIGIPIYCLGMAEPGSETSQRWAGLQELAQLTGGQAFFPGNEVELDDALMRIALELRHQYSLGYVSSNTGNAGQWRNVEVRLNPPQGLPALSLRVNKSGYFAQK